MLAAQVIARRADLQPCGGGTRIIQGGRDKNAGNVVRHQGSPVQGATMPVS